MADGQSLWAALLRCCARAQARTQVAVTIVMFAVGIGGLSMPVRGDGACCLEDGTCMQTTALQCLGLNGSYSGEGSDCATIDCFGACCLPDGSCDDGLTRIACEQQQSGSFRGNGLLCEQLLCDLRGACCLGDAGCIPDTTLLECRNMFGGTWMGLDTACDGPDAVTCRGACCFDDETCQGELALNDCLAQGGWFQDYGSDCAAGGGCVLLDGQAISAHVQRAGFNFVMLNFVDRNFTFDKFDDDNGQRLLRQVRIEIGGYVALVAILHNAGDASLNVDEEQVLISEDLRVRFSNNVSGVPNGLVSIWQPDLPIVDQPLQCLLAHLPPGGFCAFESPYFFPGNGIGQPIASTIFQLDGDMRRRSGGLSSFIANGGDQTFNVVLNGLSAVDSTLQGQGTITLNPHRAVGDIRVIYEYELARGGCCLIDGTCLELLTEAECLAQPMFSAWELGRACNDLSQPCEALGACCLCEGDCIDNLTESQCAAAGATGGEPAQFFALQSCAEVAASEACIPLGACCLGDTTCVPDVTEDECADLADHVVWTACVSCSEVVCQPFGACLLPNGLCTILPSDGCADLGGMFLGAGTQCKFGPGSCPGDANGDLLVNVLDLLEVISNWGNAGGFGDVNGDGAVNVEDLLMVISNWGNDCR